MNDGERGGWRGKREVGESGGKWGFFRQCVSLLAIEKSRKNDHKRVKIAPLFTCKNLDLLQIFVHFPKLFFYVITFIIVLYPIHGHTQWGHIIPMGSYRVVVEKFG